MSRVLNVKCEISTDRDEHSNQKPLASSNIAFLVAGLSLGCLERVDGLDASDEDSTSGSEGKGVPTRGEGEGGVRSPHVSILLFVAGRARGPTCSRGSPLWPRGLVLVGAGRGWRGWQHRAERRACDAVHRVTNAPLKACHT